MGWPCWNSMEYHWRLVKCPEALQRSCSAGISGRILRCARCGHLNLRKMTLMIWSEAPKSTSWSTLKRWPAGGWKDGKKVLTTFVAKLSFKDNWTRIIVFDFVHSPIAQFILSIWGIGDGFLTPRCDHTLHWNWESKALMVEAPVCLLQRGVGQGGPTEIVCVFLKSRNIHWEGPGLVVWDSFWRTWHTSQDATKEAVVLSWQCRIWICVFAVIFASQTLLWSAWCMIFKKHFANSVSLFASEFSTGHHAFDDIPIRKAGLTSGVSKNKRLKGSMQGLVEDVQGAESSHLTTFPPGCQHHGNHFFDLSLSDFVVDGLSLVKFASDISWYFLGPDTLWSTLCLQELLAVQKAQQAASSDFEEPPPNCAHIERMWHEHRQWIIPFPSSRKSTQRRRCRRLSRRGWYEDFLFLAA